MVGIEEVLKRYFVLMQRKENLQKEIKDIEVEIARIEGMLLVLKDVEEANKSTKAVDKKEDG